MNVDLSEGLLATFGGMFIFIGTQHWLVRAGLLDKYYIPLILVGLVMFWKRRFIAGKFGGAVQ